MISKPLVIYFQILQKRTRKEAFNEDIKDELSLSKHPKLGEIYDAFGAKRLRESTRLKVKTEKSKEGPAEIQVSSQPNGIKSRRWTIGGGTEDNKTTKAEVSAIQQIPGGSTSQRKNVAKKTVRRHKDHEEPETEAKDVPKGQHFIDWFLQSSSSNPNPNDLFGPSKEEICQAKAKFEIIAKRITMDGKTEFLIKRN